MDEATLKNLTFKFHSSREIQAMDRCEEKKGPVALAQ
jgi:hypothetical protein